MSEILADYQDLKTTFNQHVSSPLQMIDTVPDNATTTVVQHDPITVNVETVNNDVKTIMIHSKQLETPLFDETFMALEKGLDCSSINFYNAYKTSIQNGSIATGENKHIKAVHDARNGELNIKMTKEA